MAIPTGYRNVYGSSGVIVNSDTGALLCDVVPAASGAAETLNAMDVVTVDSTATGKTLATLGVTISASLKRLALIPASAGVYYALGSASASSPPLPETGIEFAATATKAGTLKFYSASSITMTVMQFV